MQPTSKQLLSILSDALGNKEDVVPPGFKTRAEWQKEWGCSLGHAKNLLKAGLDAGIIEMRKFKVRKTQGITPTPHYRPTTSGKKAKAA